MLLVTREMSYDEQLEASSEADVHDDDDDLFVNTNRQAPEKEESSSGSESDQRS